MTILGRPSFQMIFLCAWACFAISCEKGGNDGKESTVEMHLEDAPVYPPPLDEPMTPNVPEVAPEVVEKPEESGEKKPEKKELTDPELRVFIEDEKIVLEGVLKSRLQRKRMEEQLGVAFSGVRIENRIEVDLQRFAVGWGNRVTEGFLIPYFHDIEDPSVEYYEGVITLNGRGTATQKRVFHQLAGIIFEGMFSRELVNQMEVVEE